MGQAATRPDDQLIGGRGSPDTMERRLYRLLLALATATSWLVVIPSDLLLGVRPWVLGGAGAFGAATFVLALLARRGRYYLIPAYALFVTALNILWFADAGSDGSLGLYFGLMLVVLFVFFRGITRWVLFVLFLADGLGLYVVDRALPRLVLGFASSDDRFTDQAWGFGISSACLAVILVVVLDTVDSERRRLTTANERLAVTLREREAAEQQRRRLEDQLLHSRKMELVGRLAGGVAHDFNNLLTVISGNASLALDTLPRESPERPLVAEIETASHTAADLTRQLLAFSRKQVVSPRVVDLDSVVSSLEVTLKRLLGDRVSLAIELAADGARVRIDPTQIERIVVNLCANARDAMPDGGCVAITTAVCVLDDDFCRTHPEATAGRHVLLRVADSGIGMSPDVLERAFEPFFTTKGLGLATVYGMVTQNRGAVTITSRPGEGSRLSVYLPMQA